MPLRGNNMHIPLDHPFDYAKKKKIQLPITMFLTEAPTVVKP